MACGQTPGPTDMCGIFGHTGREPVDLEHARAALHRLSHRGPDQWGEWSDDRTYMGHRRLSIMDLSEQGRQPMLTDDESIVLCANGEIFNHQEIRRELGSSVSFRSGSDSEVLLHGYRAWGIRGLVERLEGMYAFVLLDRTAQRLYMVRDRVGVKPLYYGKLAGRVAWASELKALEAFYDPEELRYDATALYDFVSYLYVPSPKSLYHDIYKLEPAHYLEVDLVSGDSGQHRYWQLAAEPHPTPPSEPLEQLRALVSDSVDAQLMSDVPVGFFLSGGIDSSVVVAEAAQRSDRLHTYSIGFDVDGYSETEFARIVAEQFKTDHTERTLHREDVSASFHQLKAWYDEPFADTSAFPTHLVSQLARQTSTVVLTGDGGDELFGGYKWYDRYFAARARLASAPGAGPLARLRDAVWRGFRPATDGPTIFAEARKRTLRPDKLRHRAAFEIPDDYDDYWHYRRFYRPELPIRTRAQYMDFHGYLPDQILTKVDRASMAVSLEARVPLLATKLVEFAFTIPDADRYSGGRLKGVLKDAYASTLPSSILHREKKGFSIPLSNWKTDLLEGEATRQDHILKNLYGVDL